MILLRPGVKIKMWTGGYTNHPSIDAPWLLKLVSVLAIFSIVGALLFGVAISLTGSTPGNISSEDAIYISVLHFLMPIAVLYTVTTNSPASRVLILGYFLTLCMSTIAGKGFLGSLNIDTTWRAAGSALLLFSIAMWLFLSPKMRFYYAVISGKPVPDDLKARAAKFVDASKLNPKLRAALDWMADHLETVVLLGFTILAIFAYVSAGL